MARAGLGHTTAGARAAERSLKLCCDRQAVPAGSGGHEHCSQSRFCGLGLLCSWAPARRHQCDKELAYKDWRNTELESWNDFVLCKSSPGSFCRRALASCCEGPLLLFVEDRPFS